MRKALSSKLALLGCVSSCLMSAAYANPGPVSITLTGPDSPPMIRDVACESSPRTYTFQLKNDDDDDAYVTDIFVHRESRDDFPFKKRFVTLLPPVEANDCGSDYVQTDAENGKPGFHFWIPKHGGTCNINVQVDPSVVDCGPDNNFPTTGEIARDIVVLLQTWQRSVSAHMHFDMTFLGSAESMSLIGEQICSTGDWQCDADGSLNANHSITVPSNKGIALPGQHLIDTFISSDVDTTSVHVYEGTDPVAQAAVADLKHGFDALFAMGHPEVSAQSCNALPGTIDNPTTIRAGVQCLEIGPYPASIVGTTVTFDSNGSPIILIVNRPKSSEADTSLWIHDSLFKFAPGTSARDVIWVVDGAVEVDGIRTPTSSAYNFAGTLATNDSFEIDPNGNVHPKINGSILTFNEHWDGEALENAADLYLNGGQIQLINSTEITN